MNASDVGVRKLETAGGDHRDTDLLLLGCGTLGLVLAPSCHVVHSPSLAEVPHNVLDRLSQSHLVLDHAEWL